MNKLLDVFANITSIQPLPKKSFPNVYRETRVLTACPPSLLMNIDDHKHGKAIPTNDTFCTP